MLSVELSHLADVLDSINVYPKISCEARIWSKRIHDAIWNLTVGLFDGVGRPSLMMVSGGGWYIRL
jgi:hypothetical protein